MAAPEAKNEMEKVKVSVVPLDPVVFVEPTTQKKTISEKKVMVRVEAPAEVKNKAPIDLVVVLHVSCSMGHASAPPAGLSRLDLLKKAMKFIIGHLDGDDCLAVLTFNDKVDTEHTFSSISEKKKVVELVNKVDELVAKGDTAVKPALECAVKMLDDRKDKTRPGFIVFMSDGIIDTSKTMWSGDSADPVLVKYPIHTFGLGTTQDPKALQFMAKESKGTYSSVTENLDTKIKEAFAVCLGGLKSVVALEMRITIKPINMVITNIQSGGYTSNISNNKKSGEILVGVLYAGEVKDFIVNTDIEISNISQPRCYTGSLFSNITVTYKEDQRTTQSISINAGSSQFLVSATPTPQVYKKVLFPDPKVMQQMIQSKVLDFLDGFLKEFDDLLKGNNNNKKKNIDKGECHWEVDTIEATMLGNKWEEFKKSDNSWIEAARASVDLRGIDRDINAMMSCMKQGLGVGSVYSWISSYQMQRATATGLTTHPLATPFLTPAMEELLQESQEQTSSAQVQDDNNSASTQPEPPRGEEAGEPSAAVAKLAVKLLEGIDERFKQWHNVSPPSSKDEGGESRKLVTALQENINQAKQQDVYLAAVDAVKEWREFHKKSTTLSQALQRETQHE